MATLYTRQDSNRRKTIMLMTGFLVLVIAIGYAVSWYFENILFVIIAFAVALIMNIGSYWFSDKIVLRMTGARPVTAEEAPELYNIVENLSITAGLDRKSVV